MPNTEGGMPNAEGGMPLLSASRCPSLRLVTLSAFVVGQSAFAAACSPSTTRQLSLAVGPAGSAHEACGRAVAALVPGSGARVMVTGGAVESLQALGRARAELALAPADTVAQAVNGEGPFEGSTVSARTLATLYTSRLHLVVPEASSIHGFSQLRGHTAGIGAPGSGTDLTTERALSAALLEDKVKTRSIVLADAMRELESGRVDALFWLDGAPSPFIQRMAEQDRTKVRLLNNASVVPLLQRRFGASLYEASELPDGSYGAAEPTGVIGVPTVLMTRSDVPDAVGYDVVRSLFGSIGSLVSRCPAARGLDLTQGSRSAPAALQPGAARFYREAGTP